MAKVSVIIFTNDRAERVDELLGSLMFQTEEDFEVICAVRPDSVVLPLLRNYTILDNRIKVVLHEQGQHPLITAMQKVSAPYIAILPQSSFVNTPYIKKMLQMAAVAEDVDMVYTPLVYKDVLSNHYQQCSSLKTNDLPANSLDGSFVPAEVANVFMSKADCQIFGKLIRTEMFRKIISVPNMPIHESILFHECFYASRRISHVLNEMVFEWKNYDPYMPSLFNVKDESLKISVVMPVYNVDARYLRCCLNSLVLQTYKNLEIICVDDGSTDGSLQILREYAAKDARFKVITQKNQGVSVARNTGLKAVTGDYIAFVDSDDCISLALYQKFVAIVQHERRTIDIFIHNSLKFSPTDNRLSYIKSLFSIHHWGDFYRGHFKDFRKYYTLSHGTIWNKIFRAEWLLGSNITFPVGMIFEDNAFSIATFLKTNNIYVVESYLYFYRQLANSLVHAMNEKAFDTFRLTDIVVENLKDEGFYEQAKYKLFLSFIGTYWDLFRYCPPDRQEEFLLKSRKYLLSFDIPKEEIKSDVHLSMFNDVMDLDVEQMRKKLA